MIKKLYSVVIPTYNRSRILKKTLLALNDQTFKDFEAIIISDGFCEDTKKEVTLLKNELNYSLRYYEIQHSGPAKARNYGVKKAKGKYVLFIGDDMIPDKNCLKEHHLTRSKNSETVILGFVDWHSEIRVTSFMRYLSPRGPQFNFKNINDPSNVSFKFFYTANISLPRKLLLKYNFDENFKYAVLEDIELGYRLENNGFKLVYAPESIVYHHHVISLQDFLKRNTKIVESYDLLFKKHPELKKELIPKYLIFKNLLFYFMCYLLKSIGKTNSKLYFESRIKQDLFSKLTIKK